MKKRPFLKTVLLLTVLLSFLFGCAGKGKDVKTIKGDPEILYKQGLAKFNKRDYSDALKIFEQIKSSFPDSPPYSLWAELKIGDCHFFKKDYVEAIAAYEEFKKIHPTHEEIPYVQYQIGLAYFNQMRTLDRDQTSTRKALSSFEYLITNYPPSIFTDKAKDKIQTCRKQLGDHEFYVGNFYYKEKKYRAAAARFEGLLEKFPKRSEEDKTLYLLGKSYLEIDQWKKASEAFRKIVNEYPKSSYSKEAKAILDQGIREKRTFLRKATVTEAKKKVEQREGEPQRIALIKFEEERRQPLPLHEEKALLSKEAEKAHPGEERRVSSFDTKAPVPVEGKKVTPLIRYEEEGRQLVAYSPEPVKSISPGEETVRQGEGKAPLRVEVKPDEEKRTALLPPPSSEVKEQKKEGEAPKGEVVLKEEAEVKEREKRVASLPSPAAPPKEKEPLKKGALPETGDIKLVEPGSPIDITSDRVETYSKDNLIIFKGNVMARQKDIVIYSDSLEAVILEDGKGIEKVVAGGNVKIQQGMRVASCEKATFYNRDQKVVLTGDPKVWEGENMVSGDEIIVDIERNRIEVKGGPGRRGKVKLLPGGEMEKLK